MKWSVGWPAGHEVLGSNLGPCRNALAVSVPGTQTVDSVVDEYGTLSDCSVEGKKVTENSMTDK